MLTQLEPEEFRALGEVFERAGYNGPALLDTLGPIELPSRPGAELPYFFHLTGQGRPVDSLIRLFLLGVPVEAEAAGRVLEPVPLAVWARAGLLEVAGGQAVARVKLMPFRDRLLAMDQPEEAGVGRRRDQVMGLTASSVTLADFTIRLPARKALDLGTGCGLQALLLARHSPEVWASDCTSRALNFAAFNAGLNACGNVRFLKGDGFAPVCGERFGLVVSNPPFAITPARRYLYRDSGLPADGFCQRLIQEAPRFLEEGGFCQVVCDWVHPAGQDYKERLAGWFEGSGCDAWIWRMATQEVADYAHMWIRDTERPTARTAARVYEEWMSYYRREGIEAVSSGVIVLRRRSAGGNWIRFDDLPDGTTGPIGGAVASSFRRRDFLEAAKDDRRLMEETFRLSPDLRLQQQCEWAEGGWRIQSAQVRLERGLRYSGNVDRNALALLARCDGQRTLGQVVAELAASVGAEVERIAPQSVALVRQLVERGYLLPAGDDV